MFVQEINRLLPDGYYSVFEEGDDTVDAQMQIRDSAHRDTGVAVQIGSGDFCVSLWNEKTESVRHWVPRYVGQWAALKADIADALEQAKED